MDEPTASLTEREAAQLFAVIERLRAHGVGIIYISHRLEEICRDRRSRHGAARRRIGRDHGRAQRSTRADLIRLMVGREVSTVFPKREVALGDVGAGAARR